MAGCSQLIPDSLESVFDSLCTPCSQLPWLMLPNTNTSRGMCFFFEKKVHLMDLPEIHEKRCCGVSHGWLVMVEKSPSIFLFNPITRLQVQLPLVTTLPQILDFRPLEVDNEYLVIDCCGKEDTWSLAYVESCFMHKVTLSANPSLDKDFVAMAICGIPYRLAFCRDGDEKWTLVHQEDLLAFSDVVYWRGKFYAVTYSGELVVCDLGDPVPTAKMIVTPERLIVGDRNYLAVSSGKLLLVSRLVRYHEFKGTASFEEEANTEEAEGEEDPEDVDRAYLYRTNKFEIFELDEARKIWVQIQSLGDHMLFLGFNDALSLSANDFPECKANYIYFTDDYEDGHEEGLLGGHDLGAFNIMTGKVESLPCCSKACLIWPPPVWFMPFLC